jgi:Uroporphyrinogen decarboxylase (URO-D)
MTDKAWADMTPEEKRAWRIDKWRNPDVEFASPEAEATYKARVDRIVAAINLEKPDRVPVRLNMGFWPAKSGGLTDYEAMSDTPRAVKAWKDFNLKFQPDASVDPLHNTVPAAMFAALEYNLYAWPGHGVLETASYQYNERDWMVPEDYDHLISDPTDYLLRTYLPRTIGAYKGFGALSSFWDYIELPFVFGQVLGWGSDEMVTSLEKLTAAAKAANDWMKLVAPAMDEVKALGFPPYAGCATKAPFDILGDTLRGTKGVIVDMFRYPDKVLAACDRLVQVAVDWPLKKAGSPVVPLCFIPLHKGADGFMSDEQFHTFYWPTLRRTLIGLINEGMIPFLFAEGRYNTRLEAIMDLPKGSTVWLFDQSDMARAKETIGTVACIQGNVPLSLMHAGTAEEVAAHTRRLIDIAGKDGGFILDVGAVADEGKDENLLTMVNTAKEYGVY